MVYTKFKIVAIVSLLSACGDSSTSSTEGNSEDAEAVGIAYFDPQIAPGLSSSELTAAVRKIHKPVAIDFTDLAPSLSSSGGALNLSQIRSFALSTGFMLSDSFATCIDKAQPTVDIVTAAAGIAKQEFKTDWTKCLSDSIAEAGGSLTSAQCGMSAMIELNCPGADYSEANGKKASEALKYLGNGMAGCKMAAGVQGTVVGKIASSCIAAGTVNGKQVSINLQQKFGFLGADGSNCIFETIGSENVVRDCIDGAFRKEVSFVDGKQKGEHVVSRIKLVGAKHRLGTTSFTSSQTFDFAINNWTGSITSGTYSATYVLRNGTEAKSGSLY